ncbi:hypothetical protein SDC9_166946 [bioreactor metagenome]|uniref:Uncharacterized protein n=1 Tax=bioreactor metagenome TaxID=1076179 RepID=A0A645FYS3_9ZZZZ
MPRVFPCALAINTLDLQRRVLRGDDAAMNAANIAEFFELFEIAPNRHGRVTAVESLQFGNADFTARQNKVAYLGDSFVHHARQCLPYNRNYNVDVRKQQD